MNRHHFALKTLALLIITLATTALAHAQATRTWVSGVGDDANPCSRTAPCKTFAGAISKTAAGGEIDVLDPGGFGTVKITKAITIDGAGSHASILVSSGSTGIIVDAGPNDRVTLRNISINGVNQSTFPGITGIRFVAGSVLAVENCVIQNFNSFGIDFQPAGRSFLIVKDTVVRNSGGIIVSSSLNTARASIDHTELSGSAFGVKAGNNSRVTISNSIATVNDEAGFLADGATAEMNIESSVAANNLSGVRSRNSATIRISNVTVTNNFDNGLLLESGGQILSYVQNRIAGNGVDGAPSLPLLRQQ